MTSLSRAGLLIAIMAALLGAPSAVRGAAPNALSAASVLPSSGSTTTTFVFRVRYVSRAGNPAGTVSVTVGGRTLGMTLIAGSPTDGTYQATSRLPSGTWTTAFSATPSRGPQPSLSGPVVRVSSASTPAPTPEPTPVPVLKPSAAPTISVVEPPDASPAPTYDAAPGLVTGGGDSTPQAEPQPTDQARSTETPDDAPAPRGEKASSGEPAAVPSSRHGGGDASRPSPGAAPIGGIEDPWAGTGLPSVPLLALVFGVVVAGLGTLAWFLVGRRRRDEGETVASATAGGAEAVSQRMAERAARRQRLDPSDDPIVAALGLPERPGRGARPRAGQVHSGPGERPIPARRSRRR